MLLVPTPVTADQFTWDPDTRTFLAEASDLPALGRVYDDACDEGLTLISTQRPGEQIVFAVDRIARDADGDLMYWDLIPARPQPAARNCTFSVRIFND